MAIEANTTTIVTPQIPPVVCLTAADVRACTARVSAFRARVWPLQRPTAPPVPPPPLPPKKPALPQEPIFIEISDRRYQVESLKQASELYCAARDAFGEGASRTPEVAIVTADGCKVARISYNGRVWPAEEKPGERPLYDPLLAEPVREIDAARILVRDVIEVAAVHFGVSVDALLSKVRRQPIVGQRQIAMYSACRLTKRGMPFIGCIFGNRDHTTILHGFRRVKARLDAGDVATVEAVNAIAAQLVGGAHV